jgi:ABC-type transport system substrate-binding protein
MSHPFQESPLRDWEQEVDDIWFGRGELNANYTLDEAERTAGYHRLQEIWIEQAPWIFTFNPAVMVASAADVGNMMPQPINGFEAVAITSRLFRR